MSGEPVSNNPFTTSIYTYFLDRDKRISESILVVLDKTLLELSEDEQQTYQRFILPSWQTLKSALTEQFRKGQWTKQAWRDSISASPYTIISRLAEESLEDVENAEQADSQPLISQQTIPLQVKTTTTTIRPGLGVKPKKKAWKKIVLVSLLCLLVAVTVAGAVFGYLAIKSSDEEGVGGSAPVEAESSSGRYISYLKDGNLCYCSADINSTSVKGILVDEVNNISTFDVGPQGNELVYDLIDPSADADYNPHPVSMFVLNPEDGKVQAYRFDEEEFAGSPELGVNGYIWFNASYGTGGSSNIKRYSTTTGSFDKVTTGWLLDLNRSGNRLLVGRYVTPGSNLYLLDDAGNTIKEYGSEFETGRVVPKQWSTKGESLVGIQQISGGLNTGEIFLVDTDLNTIASYIVPGECGIPNGFDWDDSSNQLVFSTNKNKLYIVDLNNQDVPNLLDEGKITSPAFFHADSIVSMTAETPKLTDVEEKQIRDIADLWLNRSNRNASTESLWSTLSSDSKIKTKVTEAITGNESAHDKFTWYYEAYFDENIESYSIDEVLFDGTTVIAKCTCAFEETYHIMDGWTTPQHTSKIEYVFKKDSGEWKLYDYTEQQV